MMKVRWSNCRTTLATIWLSGSGFLFVLLVVQTYRGVYGPETKTAWEWFLPSIMPSLLLIVGVLGREAISDSGGSQYINGFFYRVSVALSVFYLATLAGTILFGPQGTVGRMQQSSLFLGPFQGLVSLALGVLFTEKRESSKGSSGKQIA